MASLFKFIETTLESADKVTAASLSKKQSHSDGGDPYEHHRRRVRENERLLERRVLQEEINRTLSNSGHTRGDHGSSSSSGATDRTALLLRENEMREIEDEVERSIERGQKMIEHNLGEIKELEVERKTTGKIDHGDAADADAMVESMQEKEEKTEHVDAQADMDDKVPPPPTGVKNVPRESLHQSGPPMQSVMLVLHGEMKHMMNLLQKTQEKYRNSVQELDRQERYTQEARERLEQQVSRLLVDKQSTDTELAAAVSRKESTIMQQDARITNILQQMKTKDNLIANLQSEKDETRNQVLHMERQMQKEKQQTQAQVHSMEMQLQQAKERFATDRTEWEQLYQRLEKQHADLQRDMANLQQEFNQNLEETGRLESVLSSQESELRLSQQELNDYKQRATRLLKERDQTILNLQKDGTPETHQQDQKTPVAPDSMRVDARIDEEEEEEDYDNSKGDEGEPYSNYTRVRLIGELEMLRMTNEDLAHQLEMMKRQHEAERSTTQLRIKNLERVLENERNVSATQNHLNETLKFDLKEERHERREEQKRHYQLLQSKTEEWQLLQQETNQDKTDADERKKKPNHHEIEKLQNHLIQKQSVLDTLESEKTALLLRLNTATDRIKELQLISHINPLSSDDNLESQGATENNGNRVKRMRHQRIFRSVNRNGLFYRMLDKLDTITVRSGSMLGAAPILRILFFLYCIVIHVFLFLVMEQTTVNVTPSSSSS